MIERRAFLGQLARLPLIGGGIVLIGKPTAAAEPITVNLLEAYKTWLEYERRSVSWELSAHPTMVAYYAGLDRSKRFGFIDKYFAYIGESGQYHCHDGKNLASSRAALVLSTVGCSWRESGA